MIDGYTCITQSDINDAYKKDNSDKRIIIIRIHQIVKNPYDRKYDKIFILTSNIKAWKALKLLTLIKDNGTMYFPKKSIYNMSDKYILYTEKNIRENIGSLKNYRTHEISLIPLCSRCNTKRICNECRESRIVQCRICNKNIYMS